MRVENYSCFDDRRKSIKISNGSYSIKKGSKTNRIYKSCDDSPKRKPRTCYSYDNCCFDYNPKKVGKKDVSCCGEKTSETVTYKSCDTWKKIWISERCDYDKSNIRNSHKKSSCRRSDSETESYDEESPSSEDSCKDTALYDETKSTSYCIGEDTLNSIFTPNQNASQSSNSNSTLNSDSNNSERSESKENNSGLVDEKTCNICMDKPKTHAITVCGHMICYDCGSRQQKCPFCKKKYESNNLLKLYF